MKEEQDTAVFAKLADSRMLNPYCAADNCE